MKHIWSGDNNSIRLENQNRGCEIITNTNMPHTKGRGGPFKEVQLSSLNNDLRFKTF